MFISKIVFHQKTVERNISALPGSEILVPCRDVKYLCPAGTLCSDQNSFPSEDCKAKFRSPAGKRNIGALQGRYAVIKIVFHLKTVKRNFSALQGSEVLVPCREAKYWCPAGTLCSDQNSFSSEDCKRNISALQGSEI